MKRPPLHLGLIPEFLRTEFPDLPAEIHYAAGASITYSHETLCAGILKWTALLRSKGIGQGTVVATLLPRNADWNILDAAILRCGAIHFPLYNAQRLDYHLSRFPQAFLIIHAGFASVAGHHKYVLYDELKSALKSEWERPQALNAAQDVSPDDAAMIIFSFNRQSEYIPIVITHRNLIDTAVNAAEQLDMKPGEQYLSFLPTTKIYGRVALLTFQLCGCTIVFSDQMALPSLIIRQTEVHAVALVPSLLGYPVKVNETLSRWFKNRSTISIHEVPPEAMQSVFGNRLRNIICGGAPLSLDIRNRFLSCETSLYEGYGLTQTSGVFTLNSPVSNKTESQGKPLPHMKIKVAESGEILASGSGISPGFIDTDGQLSAIVNRDGWLHTGDSGKVDDDGFVFVTGNLRNVFKLANGQFFDATPEEKIIGERCGAPARICRDNAGNLHVLLEKNSVALGELAMLRSMSTQEFSMPFVSVTPYDKLPASRPYLFSPESGTIFLKKG